MARTDDPRLAAALRENLRKRKAQARVIKPELGFGPDEEGDFAVPESGNRTGTWTSEGSSDS